MEWDGREFESSLRRAAEFGLDNCIGANDCMKACPVNRLKVNQNELDSVLVSGVWTERVQTFVTECVQCGDCTLACPIDQAQPEVIVSGCAECYAALLRLKKKTGATWTPLTTPEWLLRHADQLAWRKFDYPIAVHDSCHVTKKVGKPQPVRDPMSLS